MKIAVAASKFNDIIVDALLKGAMEILGSQNIEPEVFWVPGAFELPLMCDKLASLQKYDGIIALGCVIRGQTAHFDFVAGQCASGLTTVSLKYQLPVIFGVVTTDTLEQAFDRAGGRLGNRGADAALAVLDMCRVLSDIL